EDVGRRAGAHSRLGGGIELGFLREGELDLALRIRGLELLHPRLDIVALGELVRPVAPHGDGLLGAGEAGAKRCAGGKSERGEGLGQAFWHALPPLRDFGHHSRPDPTLSIIFCDWPAIAIELAANY